MRSDYYILEKKYREMKNCYNGVINANIKLQDERDLAIRDTKVLQKRIEQALNYIIVKDEIDKTELMDILQNG